MDIFEKLLHKKWVPFCCYILVSFLLYGVSLTYDLTFLDDNVWLKDYRWYLKDINRIPQVFTENDVLFGGLFYRPMIYVSFILDTQWAGKGYVSYHWTNIWIHIFNATLVFYLLLKFDFRRLISFCGGLLFCTHPVFVSAVAWIPGRTDSLFALFLLVSFYFFICWTDQQKKRNLITHLVLWFLALLTKETAVIAPALFGLYFFFFHKSAKKVKTGAVVFFCWMLFLGVYFLLRQGGIHAKYNKDMMVMLSSLVENLPALIPYLGKALLPLNVSVLPVMADLTWVYGFLTIGLLCGGYFYNRDKRNKVFFFGLAWFFLFILPSLIFSFLKHEYRLYVPMFGFMLVVLELLKNQKRLATGALIVCVLFMGVTLWHSGHYRDRFAFWQNAVATSPHAPLAHRNLGAMYFLNQQFGLAEEEFLQALALNPQEKMCYNNLGLIYDHRKEYLKAEESYLKEIEINPYYEVAYYNLGLFYYRLGLKQNAETLWKRTIKINPRYAPAYHQLIAYYYNIKKLDQARFYAVELEKQGVVLKKEISERLN